MQNIQLSEADNGKRVQLNKDDHVIIQLPANPTTGYNWEMQPNSHFSVSQQHQMSSGGGVGGGGVDVFELTPQTTAQGSVQFLYRRSWEDVSKAEKQFSINYQIQ